MNKDHQKVLAEVKKIQDEAQARIDKVLKELNQEPQPINESQELVFRLMELSSFNSFDGHQVVKDLKKHRSLWRGVIHDRIGSLIKLRDIDSGQGLNVDTVFILPTYGLEDKLHEVARGWDADSIIWLGEEEACILLGSSSPNGEDDKKVILRVWWD